MTKRPEPEPWSEEERIEHLHACAKEKHDRLRNATELKVITSIRRNTTGITFGGIAEGLGINKQYASDICRRLEKQGVIQRMKGEGRMIYWGIK
jgi:DNA-binding MarR family transcriptional regulator